MFGQLFALCPNDVLVLFKGLLQFQQLTRTEGSADSFWLSEGKKKLWQMGTWKERTGNIEEIGKIQA